jgi:hypothetical protein
MQLAVHPDEAGTVPYAYSLVAAPAGDACGADAVVSLAQRRVQRCCEVPCRFEGEVAWRDACVITIDRAGMAALRLRCIANSGLNKKSNLQHVGTLLSHTT